jgi:energy-converting hydrogenase Eha subunit G
MNIKGTLPPGVFTRQGNRPHAKEAIGMDFISCVSWFLLTAEFRIITAATGDEGVACTFLRRGVAATLKASFGIRF